MDSLDNIRQQFANNFNAALSSSYNKLVLQGNVGVGKTECLRNIFKYTHQYPLICFPTHQLKEEFSDSISYPHAKTPKPPAEFKNLIDTGINLKSTFPFYYEQFVNAISYDGPVLTTHDAFLIAPERFVHNIIIFDEIPDQLFGRLKTTSVLGIYEIDLIFDIYSQTNALTIEEINTIKNELHILKLMIERYKPRTETSNVFVKIHNPLSLNTRNRLIQVFNKDKYNRTFPLIVTVLLSDLLTINYLTLTISSFNKFNFLKEKKYICFSATPNTAVLDANGFKVIKTNTPLLQSVVTNIDINTSKVSLKKPDTYKLINNIIKQENIETVITFKEVDFILRKHPSVYFGNTEGTNKMMDIQSLGIVGTPMHNVRYFHDLAILCEVPLTTSDFYMVRKEFEFPGKITKIQTFKNNWLTDQHIEQIKYEYIQAFGRVRPYTRVSKVFIFSKFHFFA